MKKKIIFLLSLMIIPLLLCGCSNYNIEKLNNNVLLLLEEENFIDNSLNNDEKELIQDLIYNEKENNKVIYLNPYFSEHNYTDMPDSSGVYEESGNYYIKYRDIVFVPVPLESQEDTKALGTVYCNGHEIYFSIEDIIILYRDTKNNKRYTYSHLGTIENDNEIDVYYQSFYDSTALKIKYLKEKKKIKKIELEFLSYSTYEKQDKQQSNNFGKVLRIAILGGFVTLGVIIGFKKFKQQHNF